jgi:putative PIN family toxin of toxin-antitoxin system
VTRAVLDPNVLVSAAISPAGTPAECLRAFAGGRFELIVSERLLAELASVLARSRFRRYVSLEEVAEYVDALRREGTLVEDPERIDPVSPDPGDDYLVALARTARAHVLVSGDPHLTALMLPDLLVATPREFLGRLP